jgi:hypothetical protein
MDALPVSYQPVDGIDVRVRENKDASRAHAAD